MDMTAIQWLMIQFYV